MFWAPAKIAAAVHGMHQVMHEITIVPFSSLINKKKLLTTKYNLFEEVLIYII